MKPTIQLFSLLIIVAAAPSSVAMTFDQMKLRDTVDPNYIRFQDSSATYGTTFETLSADFNGDGNDDILSLGGMPDNLGLGGGVITFPLSMMLYQDGDFVFHDIGVNYHSPLIDVVDIDFDGDLDIVTGDKQILINDSHANFSLVEYNPNGVVGSYLDVMDWDNDDDLDILTQYRIFLNDGDLNFDEVLNTPEIVSSTPQSFLFKDLNQDTRPDILQSSGTGIQSWIQDESGQYQLRSEINLPAEHFFIQNIDGQNDKQQFVVYSNFLQMDFVGIIENDGTGLLSYSDFPLATDGIYMDRFSVQKIYNQDINNDGVKELVISALFQNTVDCSNLQNLLFIYTNVENRWQFKDVFYSEGFEDDLGFLYLSGAVTLPGLIDLNQDGYTDFILNSEKPIVWMNRHNENSVEDYYSISNKSLMQFTRDIDIMDFESFEVAADGKPDIFDAIEISSHCQPPDRLYTPQNYGHSILWINESDDNYHAFSSVFGGGNDFLQPYRYAKFADLMNQGTSSMLVTQYNDSGMAVSSYFNPAVFEPLAGISLPEIIKYSEVINLDANIYNNEIVLIADSEEAPVVVLEFINYQFYESARLPLGNVNGEFKLKDMNGDGNIDIIINNKGLNDSIAIWYNDGDGNFVEGPSFGDNVQAVAIMDINDDGLPDILCSNESHDIWIQQQGNVYVKIEYDDSFWHNPVGSYNEVQNRIPEKLQTVDFNLDGKMDLVAYMNNVYRVYLNESDNDNIWFYYIYDSYAGQDDSHKRVLVGNMTTDDFVNFDGQDILFNFRSEADFYTGLFFNPQYKGHGYAVEELGRNNLFYTIFFSYDDYGNPEWYASLNRHYRNFTGYETLYPANILNPIRYIYDYHNFHANMDYSQKGSGYLSFLKNSSQNYLDRAIYNIEGDGVAWEVSPVSVPQQRPEYDFSGLWWAGPDDAGWGVSLYFVQKQQHQDAVVVIYFYDEQGFPRWVMGYKESFLINEDNTIDMVQYRGYGRDQNLVELSEIPAGSVTLNLNEASAVLGQAGSLSMDIQYSGNIMLNDNWQRNNIPIALFSKPGN